MSDKTKTFRITWNVLEASWEFPVEGFTLQWNQWFTSTYWASTGQVPRSLVFSCLISSIQRRKRCGWTDRATSLTDVLRQEWSTIRTTKSFKNLGCAVSPLWLVLQEFHLIYNLSNSGGIYRAHTFTLAENKFVIDCPISHARSLTCCIGQSIVEFSVEVDRDISSLQVPIYS